MDARNLRTATRTQFGTADTGTVRPATGCAIGRCVRTDIPPQLAGLRVALVHDWLTGMRGGEKCLEVLCRAFPEATLYTLIHRRGSLSPAIESMTIRTSPLQLIPGVFRHYRHLLPIMPLAARAWRPKDVDLVISLSHCVAKAVVPPPGVPHVCYCFTPMRYAWQGRETYLESWSDRPDAPGAGQDVALAASGDGIWRRPSRVTHFVAISETVRERIARCYRRESRVIQPPVDVDFYTPDSRRAARRFLPGGLGTRAVQADRSSRGGVHSIGPTADRDRRRPRASTTGSHGRPDGPVPGLAARRGDPRLLSEVPRLAVPGRRRLRDRADRGPRLRRTGHRPGTRRRGRDRRRHRRPDLLRADLGCPARRHRRLGIRGLPPRSDRGTRRAEALSVPVFRDRVLKFLTEVVTSGNQHVVPPAPHLNLKA